MHILFDSKNKEYKTPFGTVNKGEAVTLSLKISADCKTKSVYVVFSKENGEFYSEFCFTKVENTDCYEKYTVKFSISQTGLYFYNFRICTENGDFIVYKKGYCDTVINNGESYQLSVIEEEYSDDFYFGATMYQIFPDRFYKFGNCDLKYKLEPYTMHFDMSDTPEWRPDKNGVVLNNDFFGGNLKGITKKLPYLKDLGINVIYLNPIFKAFSNHRYDTADYKKIDEMLGNENDFIALTTSAHALGIRIILDGVFSHTGDNSKYFDRYSVFGNGAYKNIGSPYGSWYDIDENGNYTSWWGIKSLPCVNELDKNFTDYIIDGDDSVVSHWLKAGADGFRLDVADELPDEFISRLKSRIRQINKDAILIGEVWEDASNKISYGIRRKYFTANELSSVMNYPFRTAIIDFVKGKDSGEKLKNTVMTIAENYPKSVLPAVMNILSTHDTVRILTELSFDEIPKDKKNAENLKTDNNNYDVAEKRLFAAVFLQFTLPGMASVFYGDEIGTEGAYDPFCRSFFDWDKVNKENNILNFYKKIIKTKSENEVLRKGDVFVTHAENGVFIFERTYKEKTVTACVNAGENDFYFDCDKLLFSHNCETADGKAVLKKYGFLLI